MHCHLIRHSSLHRRLHHRFVVRGHGHETGAIHRRLRLPTALSLLETMIDKLVRRARTNMITVCWRSTDVTSQPASACTTLEWPALKTSSSSFSSIIIDESLPLHLMKSGIEEERLEKQLETGRTCSLRSVSMLGCCADDTWLGYDFGMLSCWWLVILENEDSILSISIPVPRSCIISNIIRRMVSISYDETSSGWGCNSWFSIWGLLFESSMRCCEDTFLSSLSAAGQMKLLSHSSLLLASWSLDMVEVWKGMKRLNSAREENTTSGLDWPNPKLTLIDDIDVFFWP